MGRRGYAEEAYVPAEWARSLARGLSHLRSKFIPFLVREGQELCCSFMLLLDINFYTTFSKKVRMQQQLV